MSNSAQHNKHHHHHHDVQQQQLDHHQSEQQLQKQSNSTSSRQSSNKKLIAPAAHSAGCDDDTTTGAPLNQLSVRQQGEEEASCKSSPSSRRRLGQQVSKKPTSIKKQTAAAGNEAKPSQQQQQSVKLSSSSSSSRDSISDQQPDVNTPSRISSSNQDILTQPRLVFGLSSKTNRVRHNEYAAGRSNPQSPTTTPTLDDDPRSQYSKSIVSASNNNNDISDNKNDDMSRDDVKIPHVVKKKTIVKQNTDTAGDNRNHREILGEEGKPITSTKMSNESSSTKTVIKTKKMVSTAAKKQQTKQQQTSVNTNEDNIANTKQSSTTKTIINNNDNTNDVDSNRQTTPAVKKMQFNIPPPPPSKISSSKSSLVSSAKARIYDKQPPTISMSILPLGSNMSRDAGGLNVPPGGGSLPTSPTSSTLNNLSKSIVAGFKPPKQVDVRKAREKWEGGEPFAKCRSSQRYAATQAGKKSSAFLSLTSNIVASQQMQFQRALALSASRGQKYPSAVGQSDDLPVKILTRGSVLERVQKFELAPSAGEIAEASFGVTQETLDVEQQRQQLATAKDTCFVESPVAGLTTDQYLSTLNSANIKTLEELKTKSSSGSLSPTIASPLNSPLITDSSRRLSFRRQSSAGSPQSPKIPKFYHPYGKPNTYEIELQKRDIVACFDKFPDRKAQLIGANCKRNFHQIALACGFSEYFKMPLLLYVRHLEPTWSQHPSLLARRQSSSFERSPSISSLSRKQSIDNQANQDNDNNNNRPKSLLIRSASIDVNYENNKENNTNTLKYITCDQYFVCWRHIIEHAYDNVARFIHLLTFGQRNYLLPDDFIPLIQCIIDDHPGLAFLGNAPDFHMRYIQTVIARIYYNINKSWTGKLSQTELRHSNLLSVLQQLSDTNDINEITDYFSYEHFYVIYCKFWTLDQDHDLEISKEDLIKHNDASISSRIIERIFMGIVSKQIQERGKMGYSDFVWFLMAEEDKRHPRSIEYWFRLMDIDGDGYISMYEMEYFYFEQMKRLELMSIEALPFLDCACQMLDLVNPKEKNRISLSDLKRTKMVTIFYDTFINLEKYLEHESREFVSTRDVIINGKIVTDWDRYASHEYEALISEETSV